MESGRKLYVKIFLISLYLSAFTFGGGYVIIGLMKKKYVDELHWIDEEEMLSLVAIAQSSPGVIAVNASVLVGYKLAGLLGAVISAVGTVLPPLVIISIVSVFYSAMKDNVIVNTVLTGMQIGVAIVIMDVAIGMIRQLIKEKRPLFLLVLLVAFLASFVWHVGIVSIIFGCASVGVVDTFLTQKKKKTVERGEA